MVSDIDLKFFKGQEFTRRDDRHVHCVVIDVIPESLSYLVAFTVTGDIVNLPEHLLLEQYDSSTNADKQDAMIYLGSMSPRCDGTK